MFVSDSGPGYSGVTSLHRFAGTEKFPRCDTSIDNAVLTGPNKTVQIGEDEVSSPTTSGNFVDALPYRSTRTKIGSSGELTLRRVNKVIYDAPWRNTCFGAYQYRTYDLKYSHRFFDPSIIVGKRIWGAYSEFSDSDMAFVRNVAETKAKNSLRRGLTSLPMLFREREQTLKTMQSKSNLIIDIVMRRHNDDLQRYRKLRTKRDKIRFARAAAAQHLEVIFGIMPLIDDLQGLAEFMVQEEFTFVKGTGTHGITSTVKGKVASAASTKPEQAPPYGGGYSVQSRYSARCALRADITSKIGADAAQLGFAPLYTLYDAVPLSFVLSWFSNFGQWVGSMDPLVGANFRTGSTNVRRSVSSDLTLVGSFEKSTKRSSGRQHIDIYDAGGVVHKSESFVSDVRSVLDSEPDGEFEFYNNLSFYSMAASVSLAIQRKLKLPKRALSVSPFKYKGKKQVRNLPPIKWSKPNA